MNSETVSLLVGQMVVYSITKDTTSQGLVLDKVDKLEKPGDPNTPVVTGYMIQDEDSGQISPISYWRIIKVINDSLESPKRKLSGGFDRNHQ